MQKFECRMMKFEVRSSGAYESLQTSDFEIGNSNFKNPSRAEENSRIAFAFLCDSASLRLIFENDIQRIPPVPSDASFPIFTKASRYSQPTQAP
jgi:hypothetical protein